VTNISSNFEYIEMYILLSKRSYIWILTEVLREELKNARLVSNPGCYPTSVQLPHPIHKGQHAYFSLNNAYVK